MSDIRAEWAKFVLNENLKSSWRNLPDLKGIKQPEIPPLVELPDVAGLTLSREVIGVAPESPKRIKVGIVGAGVAGLFTGMIIDYLNKKVPGLSIDYEILEAAGEERLGGRLYTYKFPHTDESTDESTEKNHQYYDVGAMRFPEIPIMKRTFQLFDYIGLKDKLIPYYLSDAATCNTNPTYYNDIHQVGSMKGRPNPYDLNDFREEKDRIPKDLMSSDPDQVLGGAIQEFKQGLKSDIEKGGDLGWQKLMKYDLISTRQFLSQPTDFGGMGYNFNTTSWLETFEYATGWFDQSLTETVLESMDFDYPLHDNEDAIEPRKEFEEPEEKVKEPEKRVKEPEQKVKESEEKVKEPEEKVKESEKEVKWKCIDGGTQQVAEKMMEKLTKKPQFNMEVDAISTDSEKYMELLITNKNPSAQNKTERRKYFAVFNSTTLAALQRMDLKGVKLTYGTKQAIRSLGYGASCKIAIRFSRPWWITDFDIKEGGVGRTDLPIRVCVYPSYNIHDPPDQPAVLLCSYTWSQDALRIASLITQESPKGEDELKTLLMHNLTLLHARSKEEYDKTYELIDKSYITHHAYDWYKDPYMSGAFAYFGPGQFSVMYNEIVVNNGWLFLIGEATSAHHAWIVGALESAVRGVYQFLNALATIDDQSEKSRGVYEEAMKWLTSAEDGIPFGPLPDETTASTTKSQVVLGFFQQKAEEVAKGKTL